MKSYFLSHLTAHITGTHCPILHEPPPEHNFIFVPEDGSALTLLQSNYNKIEQITTPIQQHTRNTIHLISDYSIYNPNLPAVIKAHPKFGDGRQLFVDGFLDDEVLHNNLPIFTITDNFGRKVFQVKINPDPGVQSITCTSELNSVKCSRF